MRKELASMNMACAEYEANTNGTYGGYPARLVIPSSYSYDGKEVWGFYKVFKRDDIDKPYVEKIKMGKLKYGCKLQDKFFPPGTEVEVCGADDFRVQDKWPGIKSKEESDQIAIIFPGEESITIHSANHVIVE